MSGRGARERRAVGTCQFIGALLPGQLDLAHAPLADGLDEGIVARGGGDDGAISVLGGAMPLAIGPLAGL